MAKKKESQDARPYKIGDHIKVMVNDGRKVDAVIRAIFHQDNEPKLNIDYGNEETATVEPWPSE